jgi:electron transfer flavoprotein beta subunit
VAVVTALELGEGKATCKREVEGGVERVETTLPAVITAQKGLNEPRYASLKGIMAAKKKPIQASTWRRWGAIRGLRPRPG